MTARLLLSIASALLLHSTPALAQVEPNSELEGALAEWRSEHGAGWDVVVREDTGWSELLYGASLEPSFRPTMDAEFVTLAREFVDLTVGLHGLNPATLVEGAAVWLPLVGTTDKVAVRFRQEWDGVSVEGGRLNVLLDNQGRLLSVHSTSLTDLSGLSTTPTYDDASARDRAILAFSEETQLDATRADEAELVIAQETSTGLRRARLAWRVDVIWEMPGTLPVGRTLFMDAITGGVIESRNLVHQLDVTGTVVTLATPGTSPDSASNPAAQTPAAYARVTSSAGTVYTDVDGHFNFAGVTTPLDVTVDFTGLYNDVNNDSGAEFSITQTAQPAQANTVVMNPSPTEYVTSQANAFVHCNAVREYVRAIVPGDDTADFVMTANVNQTSTCNAFFNGNSTNYYRAGGGCVNTGYSTVVAHETGHWLNVLYGTGNGNDGMGEGNADVWAMYINDHPIVGEDFCGGGCNIRDGQNMNQFCGDCCGGCYGGVHADGEVWMGAAWKVRRNLNTTWGDDTGDAIADGLFMGWVNSYNQTQIKSIIEIQWLTLDDDDGNIDNGTPHHGDIDAAFLEQGFPGFELNLINFSDVTEVPDTVLEAGPYGVVATITSLVAPPVTGASLFYRVNGGAFVEVVMGPSSGDDYAAQIPDVPSPARVEYYLTASDVGGNTDTWPSGAPAWTASFTIGETLLLFAEDFEGSNDGGWSHGSRGDTLSNEDDWERGAPQGLSGGGLGVAWSDPSSAAGGTSCWGNDLGMGAENGAYNSLVHSYVRSPAIDCSASVGTTLRFNRWLTVEQGANNDFAKILVNGEVVWENDFNQHTLDTSWVAQEIDIAAQADGQASVQVEFEIQTGWIRSLGGWNLDDFELYTLGPSQGQCPTPIAYGVAKVNTNGWTPIISSTGTPSVTSGDFAINMDMGMPSQPVILISSASTSSNPFMGGTLWIAPPVTRHGVQFLDSLGSVSYPYGVDGAMVGTTQYFQLWYRDPADAFGVGLSGGLEVTYCD